MAFTIFMREALHAGMPVLRRFRMKQNTKARKNVIQLSIDTSGNPTPGTDPTVRILNI